MELAFADCVLCLTSRQLLRGGAAVPLEPKMYTLLEALVTRRPAVLTYAELDELLWPRVYVSRTSLTRLVSELRTVLGDASGEARLIRTVYKTGYAFAADVKVLTAPRPAATTLSLGFQDRWLPLGEGSNVIGRDQECSVVIDATTVSRRHARITVTAGAASIEDLNSTNGTFVNRQPVTPPTALALAAGDEIAFGKALVTLRMADRQAPTEVTPERHMARGERP